MGLSFRHYLFLNDGSLRRVPQRIADELPNGTDAIPEFAGTRQRVAQVIVENDERRPVRILDARGFYWSFDDAGRIDADLRRQLVEHMDMIGAVPTLKGRVVDLVPEIKKRELQARSEWTLTGADLDRIAADIWPGGAGPASEVTTVKGKAPRKPPLTNESRWALERIGQQVVVISSELAGLSERALKGLAFEAHRLGSLEDEALWRGVADEAKRREAIRAAYRTGKGEWIAVLTVSREDPEDPVVRQHIQSEHVRCATREGAIEAGRRLMAEKAEWLDTETFVEAEIVSALKWQAE